MVLLVQRKRFKWYVRLVVNHNSPLEETLMHSETYFSKSNAVRAAKNLTDTLNNQAVANRLLHYRVLGGEN